MPVELSREAIVRAALGLADSGGLESVSIRKVAGDLGVGPMRLYQYLDTKDDLLDLMVDEVQAEIVAQVGAQPDGGWRQRLTEVAGATRRAALRHEWLVEILGGRPALGPHSLLLLEISAAASTDRPGPVDGRSTWQLLAALNAYVLGAARREVAERRAARTTGVTEAAWQAGAGPYLGRMLATGRFPVLARSVLTSEQPDSEAAFEYGLACLLDGIERRSEPPPSPARPDALG